jgi:hypothetical protein
MLGDIKTSIEILDKLSKWLRDIVARSSGEQQRDAVLLGETGKLFIALRALDNEIHALLGQLTLFDLDWPVARRQTLMEQINAFAHREQIIRMIRESLKEVQKLMGGAKKEDWKLALEVFGCGASILRTMSDSDATPFPDTDALRDFVMRIKNAKTADEVQKVIQSAKEILDLLDRKRLAAADEAFGRLKGQILLRHPTLPAPPSTAGQV